MADGGEPRQTGFTDNSRISSSGRRPEIRQTCDVHIIYDRDHVGADNPVQLVRALEDELKKQDYEYTDCGSDCLPGIPIIQQQVDHITQADFVVCFISLCQQAEHVSARLLDHVKKAMGIKLQSGLIDRVMPVFCNVSEEQAREIRDADLPEMMVVGHIIARHSNLTFTKQVLDVLALTPSSKIQII